jgi:hypothetical protein
MREPGGREWIMSTTIQAPADARGGRVAKLLVIGFVAGFLAVPLGHQVMAFIHYELGMRPTMPWEMGPATRAAHKAFGLPSVVNLSFWGGVWGVVWAMLQPLMPRGALNYIVAILFGGVCATAFSVYGVTAIKGLPMGSMSWIGFEINGAWGLATAFFYNQMSRRFA